jgi:hypothetical protein
MGKRIVRYSAALILFVYAFAKLNGSQFTILDSELDKPMGQVSGFWLTWYYFGFSHFYGNAIAAVQLVGAFLLTFRRTTLLGACILTPVLANIVLIDICYRIDPGATVIAMLLLLAMIGLIAPHTRELATVLLQPTSVAAQSTRMVAAKWAVRVAMLALACGFTYQVANYNNRLPTPMDGVWDVVEVEPQSAAAQLPKTIFFEYNRAYMAVFKTSDGKYTTHHFEIDAHGREMRLWEAWLQKGRQIFDGHYTLSDRDLSLIGTWENLSAVSLRLQRRVR